MKSTTYNRSGPRQSVFNLMLLASIVTIGAIGPRDATAQTPSTGSRQEYWPGWLGPKRDGWVSGFQPPTRWPERLKKRWQVEVGTGYGSPLVSGGRVYQHARQGDDEVVWSLDLETGAVKWRQSYATPFKIGGGAERHGKGPKSSPALADGRVFTMSITGILTAWHAGLGKRLWRRDYSSRFKKGHPYWGAATSPIVDGDRVVVHFGTDGQGALVALDAESGKEIWSHGKDGPAYSSPLLVEIEGIRQIVEWNERALAGVDSESGRLLWEHPFPQVGTDQNMPTPAFHSGLVLLGAENRGVHGLEPKLDGGVWTVKERWHQEKVAHDMSSAVVNGDLLYGFSHYDSGRLFCLDPKTGDVLWQGPGRTGENVMFLAIPGHVVALVNDGELLVIAATGDRFEKVASYQVAESPTWAPPVLLKSGILVKDRRTLTLWSLTASGDDIAPGSSESFESARAQLQDAIESGEVAGGAHLVVRDGKTRYLEVAGVCDIEDKRPLKADTIVRLYSMTKPITSVTAMTLFEQGKFQLDDPVGKFIPAFSETTVLEGDGDSVRTVPASRPITVRDVLRHTTGFSYGGGDPSPRKYYQREGMRYRPPAGMLPPEMSIKRAAEALARIPALHHPGERFTYGFSTDLLGRLIEVWSGKPLDQYMQQAVFEPLEMVDTGFSVAKGKRDRFASCHTVRDGKLAIVDKSASSAFNEGFEFLSGGGGLVSTIKDYANFCQMLVDGGEFKGEQLLKKETVRLMFTDQLKGVAGDFRFGLGFAIGEVQLGSGENTRKAAQYSWGGYASTDFRIVPEGKLFQIFVRQRVPSAHGLASRLFPIIYKGVGTD